MRGGWFSKRLIAVLTPAFGLSLALGASSLSAAQQRQINQVNPDLDTEDQLAPSQMKQPVPAAVPHPASAMHSAAPTPTHAGPAPAIGSRTHTVACNGTFAEDSRQLKLPMTFDYKHINFPY